MANSLACVQRHAVRIHGVFSVALTILGLGMRLVSIPMIINLIVAILTVKLKIVSGLDDFVELDEPLYALSLVWGFFRGRRMVESRFSSETICT